MRDTPRGRVRAALVGATVVVAALATTGVVAELARTPVEEPVAVSWSPGGVAPVVGPVAAPTTDTRNCGGYVIGLPVGEGVPEAR